MDAASRSTYRGLVTKICKTASEFLQSTAAQISETCNLDSIEEELTVLVNRLMAADDSLRKANEALQETVARSDDLVRETERIAEYEDLATGVLSRLNQRLKHVNERREQPIVSMKSEATQPHVGNSASTKLPKLQLRKFSGNLNDWLPFWEQFRVAVHENKNLSGAERFNYLQSVLVGAAEKTIAGFTPTESCYDGAIALLQEEYGNNDKLIEESMLRLMELQAVSASTDSVKLRQLYNTVTSCTRSLTALGVPISKYSMMLKPILLRCLPKELRVDYHRMQCLTSPPDAVDDSESTSTSDSVSVAFEGDTQIRQILKFVKREVESLEKAGIKRDRIIPTTSNSHTLTTAAAMTINANAVCIFCSSHSHVASDCNDKRLGISDKREIVKAQGRCFRCLKKGHVSRQCKVRVTCKICSGRHVAALCNPQHKISPKPNNAASLCSYNVPNVGNIFLQTACVKVFGTRKSNLFIRLIIDSGSHYTFVRESIARKLNLEVIGTRNLNLSTFGGVESKMRSYDLVKMKLKNIRDDRFVTVTAFVVPEISYGAIPMPRLESNLSLLPSPLADYTIDDIALEDGIGVLIGTDSYWSVVTGETKRINGKLFAIETIFGWTLHGPDDDLVVVKKSDCDYTYSNCFIIFDDNELPKLWTLDAIGIANEDYKNQVDIDAFKRSILKTAGRYQVNLPWKSLNTPLSDNREVAFRRFNNLTRKLSRDPSNLIQYDNGIREYISEGYAEKVDENCSGDRVYYMPHRGIYREDKVTTKLRIVFDASSHAPGVLSLNDHLHTGPNLLLNMSIVLLNFRLRGVGLVADTEKAYLRIQLAESDRDAHRFFWYEEPVSNRIICIYRMTCVTFGVTSSTFQLATVIDKHLDNCHESYPESCEQLKESLYADDLATSSDDAESAKKLYDDAVNIMNSAGMNLRKWNSNDVSLRRLFESDNPEYECPFIQKVLGMKWFVLSDELGVEMSFLEESIQPLKTKRNVLEIISRIFDPLGMVAPVVIKLKIMFQDLWKNRVDWDDPLNDEFAKDMQNSYDDLRLLNEFAIPRCAALLTNLCRCELHIFSDASLQAFGAVAYLRCVYNNDSVSVRFLCAKSRVAPLKENGKGELSLPRLELTAAFVASRMLRHLSSSLRIKIQSYRMWSDSQITLHWIKGKSQKWKPYVRNRVEEITSCTSIENWMYCPGKENPADLLTRGIKAKTLRESEIWKEGPKWLKDSSSEHWPQIPTCSHESGLVALVTLSKEDENAKRTILREPLLRFERFSGWARLLRVTAWIIHFVSKASKQSDSDILTANRLNDAEVYWIKYIQHVSYPAEIEALIAGRALPRESKIRCFDPVVDAKGVLRVTGRLQALDEDADVLHPIILPKSSPVTILIMRETHERFLHCGVSTLLSILRERFWIPKVRPLAKALLKRCVICQKLLAKPRSQPFPPLPRERLIASRPFETVGVDFAGPLFVKHTTSDVPMKCYILLFTCAVIRAVHLELVTALTTDKFLTAFRRFVARRGIPKVVFSDNAKTFKRASFELSCLDTTIIRNHFNKERIEWRFIVERAPWWGGFWERMVRSVKMLLKTVIGKRTLDLDEMSTLLCESEGVINARPLTYITEDVDNLIPLTPAHFLLGYREVPLDNTIQVPEITSEDMRKRWRQRLKLTSSLWKRWKLEYLRQLREHHTNSNASAMLFSPGQVVLVYDQAKPRIHRKLATVETVFPGRDGLIRACEVCFADGTKLRRSVQHLYVLELN